MPVEYENKNDLRDDELQIYFFQIKALPIFKYCWDNLTDMIKFL